MKRFRAIAEGVLALAIIVALVSGLVVALGLLTGLFLGAARVVAGL